MEHQCEVKIKKLLNGFLVTRTKGPTPFIEDGYCFQHFSGLMAWLYEHFREEGEPEEEVKTGWISVDERVPEAGQRVIVWAQGKNGFPFVLDYEGGGLTNSFVMAGEIVFVTHWMPMPDPPSGALDCGDCVINIHNVAYKNS